MPKGMQPIYTQTTTSTVGSVTFNNIPQTYTDLKIQISARATSGIFYSNCVMYFNGITTGTGYSTVRLTGDGQGGGSTSDRIPNNNFFYVGEVAGDVAQANAFGNVLIYIPNYTSTTNKQIIANNANQRETTSQSFDGLHAQSSNHGTPVTGITFTTTHNGWLPNSTFTIYGISK